MALPSIPLYWLSKKDIMERMMAERRNRETRHRQLWDTAAKDFDLLQLKAVKHNTWTSNSLYQYCSESYRAQVSKQSKAKQLEERRTKLAKLLQQEDTTYEAELKQFRRFQRCQLPDISFQQKKLEDSPPKRKEIVKQMEEVPENVMENGEDKLIESDSESREQKLTTTERTTMLEQLQELKLKEAEMTKLKKEQERLQLQRWRLQEAEDDQLKTEKKQLNQEYGHSLKRQYKFQLQKQANEIMEELKRDLRNLQRIAEENLGRETDGDLKRDKVRLDYITLKKLLEDQLSLEQFRKSELETLFNEEAGRLWRTRKAEWTREHALRKKLLREVTEGLERQIEEHMAENLKQQQLLVEERERLLKEVMLLKQREENQQEMALQSKEAWKEQITSQIRDNEHRELSQMRRSAEERPGRRLSDLTGNNSQVPQITFTPASRSRPVSVASQTSTQRKVAWM